MILFNYYHDHYDHYSVIIVIIINFINIIFLFHHPCCFVRMHFVWAYLRNWNVWCEININNMYFF